MFSDLKLDIKLLILIRNLVKRFERLLTYVTWDMLKPLSISYHYYPPRYYKVKKCLITSALMFLVSVRIQQSSVARFPTYFVSLSFFFSKHFVNYVESYLYATVRKDNMIMSADYIIRA